MTGTVARTGLLPAVVDLVDQVRAAGVEVPQDRVHGFVAALDALGRPAEPTLSHTDREVRRGRGRAQAEPRVGHTRGALRRARHRGAASVGDVRLAARATLCASPEDLVRLDAVLDRVVGGREPGTRRATSVQVRFGDAARRDRPSDADTLEPDGAPAAAASASRVERLRDRDLALLSTDERREVARLVTTLARDVVGRPTRRRRPARTGPVDRHRTVREMLAAGGEPVVLRRHAPVRRPRPLVVVVDVSGSMAPYADLLLRFAHAALRAGDLRQPHARVEVFTLGTRLTRVTEPLRGADPDRALQLAGAVVRDHGGGTRLGEGLRALLAPRDDRGIGHVERVRGATTVVLSDAWERDDPAQLGAQAERLSRLAHRLLWANPRAGRAGFEPTAGGVAAVLPHVDAMLPCTTLVDLEALATRIADHRSRTAA